MAKDIRDKPDLGHEDVIRLNFIRHPGTYVFRRHHRQGLRSHIMEVLNPDDIEKEHRGIVVEDMRWYPRAKPVKILRIFRAKFNTPEDALEEIRRVKIVEDYMAPDHLAVSSEFLVDYFRHGRRDFILCGLQEYVEGEVLDPWSPIDESHLAALFGRMGVRRNGPSKRTIELLIQRAQTQSGNFITRIKKMVLEANYVPDLAGVENILLTPRADIKLVDINNISKVTFEPTISTDDKGYPVCDKSIEALSLLEEKLLGRPLDMEETIYRTYLDPRRIKEVNEKASKCALSVADFIDDDNPNSVRITHKSKG